MSTVSVESERLILRQFVETDAEACFKNWQSDPFVALYIDEPYFKEVNESLQYIRQRIFHYSNPDFYDWAIVLKETDEVIGEIHAVYSRKHNTAEIGYAIGSAFWGNGYASEAVETIIDELMDQGIHRVLASCTMDNVASQKVLLKSGMRNTGSVPDSFIKLASCEDLQWFSIERM